MTTKDISLDSKIDAILDRFWSRTPIGEVGKCRKRTVQHILDLILSERSEAYKQGYIDGINTPFYQVTNKGVK